MEICNNYRNDWQHVAGLMGNNIILNLPMKPLKLLRI